YSLGEADLLRRAMGKKIKKEMDKQRTRFVSGAVANGVDKGRAQYIFELVAKFAGYGFNKSHAAAYALVAYQTAWLKANHPVEFLAASMTLDLGNTDKLNVFRQELMHQEIPLLPPDINDSGVVFGVRAPAAPGERGAIRYALAAIKNVGAAAMGAVVAERDANGPFKDVYDFAERVGAKAANKRQLESLIRAGAFDSLIPNRRQLVDGVDILLRTAAAAARARETTQTSMFDGDAGLETCHEPLPDIEDWPAIERLNQEFDALGFYLSAHPLDAYGSTLARLGVVPFESLTAASAGSQPRLAGVVVRTQERTSAKGNRFAFLSLSGPTGLFEVIVFADVLATARDLLSASQPLLLTCEARADGDGVRLSATAIEALDDAVARTAAGLKVHIDRPDALDGLKRAIDTGARGKGRVWLVLDLDEAQSVEVALPGGYAISAEMRAAIDGVPGVVVLQDI
ncbi:MAG: DNA polymerase III subunit alpha, partial [Alphaproteobacteria bacterium]